MDRPTPEVELEVERLVMSSTVVKTRAYWLDFPVVSSQGERYMEARNVQLEALHDDAPKYVAFWDDDFICESPEEAIAFTKGGVADLVYAKKRYFWGSLATYTNHLPEHNSVFLFRRRRGDQFPLDRIIQAPEPLHSEAKHVFQMTSPLLDVGYMDPAERQLIFKKYAQAGKIDALTRKLVEEPKQLEPIRFVTKSTQYLIQAISEYKRAKSSIH